jgi:hypothetical protein
MDIKQSARAWGFDKPLGMSKEGKKSYLRAKKFTRTHQYIRFETSDIKFQQIILIFIMEIYVKRL